MSAAFESSNAIVKWFSVREKKISFGFSIRRQKPFSVNEITSCKSKTSEAFFLPIFKTISIDFRLFDFFESTGNSMCLMRMR